MDKSYMNIENFLRDFNSKNHNINRDKAPQCINDDFCVPSPKNRNDGILTMAFVDMQPLDSVYSTADAFCAGTLFPNLDKPFFGGRSR